MGSKHFFFKLEIVECCGIWDTIARRVTLTRQPGLRLWPGVLGYERKACKGQERIIYVQ